MSTDLITSQSKHAIGRQLRFVIGLLTGVMAIPGMALADGDSCPAAADMTPAMIISNDRNIELVTSLLDSWRSDKSATVVVVEGFVTKKGRVKNSFVANITAGTVNERTLLRKIGRLRLEPARVAGASVDVYTSFSIVGTQTDYGVDTVIVMNKLRYIDDHGLYYSAPQRIAATLERPEPSRDMLFDLGAHIEPDGTVASLDYNVERGEESRFMLQVIDMFNESCFIPGKRQALNLPMQFVERFK